MENERFIRRQNLIKLTINGLILQLIFYFTALMVVLNYKVSNLFWEIIGSGFKLGLLLLIILSLFGFVIKKAWFLHSVFAITILTWMLPFLAASYELVGANLDFLVQFLLAGLIFVTYACYQFLKTLIVANNHPATLGRLNIQTGFWDLRKPLYVEKNDNYKKKIARSFIPLGGILGILLYRVFPSQPETISIILILILTGFIMYLAGIHLAITIYIFMMQRKLKLVIHV